MRSTWYLMWLGSACLAAVTAEAQITVGPNVQVSVARLTDAHYELYAAADPTNPARLLACSMVFPTNRHRESTVVYLSEDGGANWTPALQPDDLEWSGDPVCAFGPDGTAYYLALGRRHDNAHMFVWRSGDPARGWDTPVVVPLLDRPAIAFDSSGGTFHGNAYINGTAGIRSINGGLMITGLSVLRSLDNGGTFIGPVTRAAIGRPYVVGMGNSVVLSDGTIISLFGELKEFWAPDGTRGEVKPSTARSANAALKVIHSEDGGETLQEGVTVADWFMDRDRSQGSHIPVLAVDPGSAVFKDRLYAVWNDARSRRLEVLLSYSADKGKTWSKPVVVNDDRIAPDPARGPDAITPLAAVNAAGVVAVTWNDRRDHPDNLGYDKRIAVSFDGGQTFLPSVRVSSQPNVFGKDEQWTMWASASGGRAATPLTLSMILNPFFYSEGHTGGLTADAAGVFHPVWIDNRTGTAQVWTAAVRVNGQVTKHGAPELDGLDDVSDKIAIEITAKAYDRATNTAAVTLRLKNSSKDVVHGPLKLRILSLHSDVGIPSLEGAAGGSSGVGAILDFSALVTDGRLASNQTTAERTLTLRLTDLRPLHDGHGIRRRIASLDARVFGRVDKAPATPSDEAR